MRAASLITSPPPRVRNCNKTSPDKGCFSVRTDPSANAKKLLAVNQRASQTLKIAERNNWLLDIGLDHLTLARTALYQALLENTSSDNVETAINLAVTYLRRYGSQDRIPSGLLTRAWLRVWVARQDASTAAHSLTEAIKDLDEASEIAERGPMPLHMADIHLHRARLFGRVSSYPWDSPQADLAEARRLIVKHGYGRRKQELEDAEKAFLRWERQSLL